MLTVSEPEIVTVSDAVVEPPVAFTLYPEPAPITNLSCKLGVPLFPSQRYHPDGIAFAAPDQMMIPP